MWADAWQQLRQSPKASALTMWVIGFGLAFKVGQGGLTRGRGAGGVNGEEGRREGAARLVYCTVHAGKGGFQERLLHWAGRKFDRVALLSTWAAAAAV
jgi:hypothetical protein